MRLTEAPARDVRPLIGEIHADLLGLLASLRDAEWRRQPRPAAGR